MKIVKNDILFWLAIVFALWFTLTGIFWVYWFAIIFAYPFGILSLGIWFSIKSDQKERNKAIPILLIIGTALSLGMLLYLLLQG